MALITSKMHQQMFDFQEKVASQGVDIYGYVERSFTAISGLIESGHLRNRKAVQQHIDMTEKVASAFINETKYNRVSGAPTPKKARK